VIVAVAVCPHPPLLFRELTGRDDVAADLRSACRAAVTEATSVDADVVVVVGGAEDTASWDPGLGENVRRFGTAHGRAAASGLPLSLGVASRLLAESGWSGPVEMHAVGWDAPAAETSALGRLVAARADRVVLLVLGEGSARRGDTAPGYLDERAFSFDEDLGRALAAGDVAELADLDPTLAGELMATCRAPFAVLAPALRRQGPPVPGATVLYQDDPWGVMYYVAMWSPGPADSIS
jgi:hypothetical protein